jgi:hypothetical protein
MPQIDENAVQVVTDGSAIQYFVSSCLTITCGFADSTMIGAHFSHGEGGTFGDSVTTWGVFKDTVEATVREKGTPAWVNVRGQIDMWQPAYLTTRRLQATAALAGDLSGTISLATGRDPDISTKTGSIVVTPDGLVA